MWLQLVNGSSGPHDFDHWLYGRRGETEVVVLTFDVDSGSNWAWPATAGQAKPGFRRIHR